MDGAGARSAATSEKQKQEPRPALDTMGASLRTRVPWDPTGSGAAAGAAAGWSPDPPHQGRPAIPSSGSLETKVCQQGEEISRLSAENKYLNQKVEEISEEIKQLKDQLIQQSNNRDEEINRPKQEFKKAQEKLPRFPGFRGKNFPMEGPPRIVPSTHRT